MTRVFSDAVLAKSRSYLANGHVHRDAEAENMWWVQGADLMNSRPYRVQVVMDGDLILTRTCTCEHGKNAGGSATCSHVAAALIRKQQIDKEGGTADDE
jgi:uncharacterized Zn finger protein